MIDFMRWGSLVWLTVAGEDLWALKAKYPVAPEVTVDKIPLEVGRIAEQLQGRCAKPGARQCQECPDRVCHARTRGRALVAARPAQFNVRPAVLVG